MKKEVNRPMLIAKRYRGKKGTPGFILWYTKVYRYHAKVNEKVRTLKPFVTAAGAIRNNINTLKRVAKDNLVKNEPRIKEAAESGLHQPKVTFRQWANRLRIPFYNELAA